MGEDFPYEWKPKESWSGIPYFRGKKYFKIKTIIRDKEGYYIMIKGSIQEKITIVNMCPTYEHLNT